jgi:hypothetical protein
MTGRTKQEMLTDKIADCILERDRANNRETPAFNIACIKFEEEVTLSWVILRCECTFETEEAEVRVWTESQRTFGIQPTISLHIDMQRILKSRPDSIGHTSSARIGDKSDKPILQATASAIATRLHDFLVIMYDDSGIRRAGFMH